MRPSSLRRFLKSLTFRFIAIAAVAVAAIVPGRLIEARHMQEQAAETGNAALARIADAGIGRLTEIIEESRTILAITALLPTFAAAGTPDCHRTVTPLVAEIAWVNSLSAIGADGVVTCSSSSVAEGTSLADRPYLREAMATHHFQLSGIVTSRVTKMPTLFAVAPVRAPGSGTAALLLAINASWLSNITEELAHSVPSGFVMAVDAEGNVIARSDNSADDTTPDSAFSRIDRLEREGTQPVTLADGRAMVLAVREIPYTRALLVVGVPRADLDRPMLTIQANLISDLSIAIATIVLILWLGLESFVRPVLTLAAAARRMGDGRFDIAIDSQRWASEFQTLATAITAAAANLASRAQADAEARASLRAQSLEDPLTGLKNRRGLDLYVEFEWRICRRAAAEFAVVAFDIDYFKQFNDCYGHAAGDQALRAVAAIMRDQAREAGGIATRTGGEEFTIVAPGKSVAEAMAIASAVLLRVTALRIRHTGSPFGLMTLSAGIATAKASDALSASDIFRAADLALYGAKGTGRNTMTLGEVIPRPNVAQPDDDICEPQPGSSQDTESRMPQAFPSAMSR